MNYEYNGNLLEEDRINLVSNEIINCYPEISIEEAKQIAMLEGKISTNKNLEIEFTRLYNIMLIKSIDKIFLVKIYPSLMNILNNNRNDIKIDYYLDVAHQISNYILGKGEFPLLNEF